MVEKIRFGGNWNFKKWVAVVLFGIIIIVFALWGVKSGNMSDDTDGVAAVVNDHPITLAEFRQRSEQIERNAKGRLDGLPEAERRARMSEVRRRILEQLTVTEAIYQAASRKGVMASDAEVREQILQALPFVQENGRFLGERYRMWLQNSNMSAEDFEHQIRRELVTEKLQELFVGSATPSSEELKRNRELAAQKVNIRFLEVTSGDLKKMDAVPDTEVAVYIPQHKKEIEAYYNENKIDFTTPEKYRARDILIRVDEKRPESEALKTATELKKQLTAKNFAAMATKNSEDPGLKTKGGELGERQKGTFMPEFEAAVGALKPGEISEPVKLGGGYHLILLESRSGGGTTSLAQAESDIARRLISRGHESEIMTKLGGYVAKGDKASVEGMISKAKLKWTESGEFNLAATAIPKLGEAKEVMTVITQQGRKGGLIPKVVPMNGNFVLVDVLSFKEVPNNTPDADGLERMLSYRRAEGAIDQWAKAVRDQASIQMSGRLMQ